MADKEKEERDRDKEAGVKYRVEVTQMMFVAGETGEMSFDTTTLMENIVREQVIEMLTQCAETAARRGTRSIGSDDLIFLYRHDRPKVSRLYNFLLWKDVRKTAKDSDDRADNVEIPEEAGNATNPQQVDLTKRAKGGKVRLPWDINSFFNITLPDREDDEDDEDEELNQAMIERLKAADERTKGMTKEEYVQWSECRQASFTFRKSKRFREWAMVSQLTDGKPNDDVIDILGFLTFEMVQTITEEALKVKDLEDKHRQRHGEEDQKSKKRKAVELDDDDDLVEDDKDGDDDKEDKDKDEDEDENDEEDEDEKDEKDEKDENEDEDKKDGTKPKKKKKKKGNRDKKVEGLFKNADPDRTPLQPRHVHEAYRLLKNKQIARLQPMNLFSRRVVRSRLPLVSAAGATITNKQI